MGGKITDKGMNEHCGLTLILKSFSNFMNKDIWPTMCLQCCVGYIGPNYFETCPLKAEELVKIIKIKNITVENDRYF